MLYNLIPLKDTVHPKPRDCAKFLLKLYNNENKTFSVDLYINDPSWSLIYFPSEITLKPFEEKEITLYLCPIRYFQLSNEVNLIIKYDNKKDIVPLEINIKGVPYVDIFLNYTSNVSVGDSFKLIACINSSIYNEFKLSLDIFNLKRTIDIYERSFCKDFVLKVPLYISSGKYKGYLTLSYENFERKIPIVVNVFKNETPIVERKDGEVIIKNPHQYPIYYEYKLKLDKNLIPFMILKPKPNYIFISDNETYAFYKLFLYPNETKIIKMEYNYPLLFVIFLPLLAAFGIIIYLYYLSPKVSSHYQIIKIDKENKKIKLLITVSNYGKKEAKDVLIQLKLPAFLKVDKMEFVEGKVEDNKVIWKLDLKPGEERLILVTLSYEIEPTEPFKLELKVKHKKEKVEEIIIKI